MMLLSRSFMLCRKLKNYFARGVGSLVPQTPYVNPQRKSIAKPNRREAELVMTVMKKYELYNSHLLGDQPEKLSEQELQSLSIRMKKAVASQDIHLFNDLGKNFPNDKNQQEHLRQQAKSSDSSLFITAQKEYFTVNLKKNLSREEVIPMVTMLYYNTRLLSLEKIDVSSFVSKLDSVMEKQHKNMPIDIRTWCHYMQWRLSIEQNIPPHLCKIFMTNIVPNSQSIKDLLAVSAIIGIVPQATKLSDLEYKAFRQCFATIMLGSSRFLFNNVDVMAVLCRGILLTVCDKKMGPDRRLSSLMWEVLAYNMKTYQEPELSTSLGLCVKCALESMDRHSLKMYPYLFDKTFSSIEAISQKLIKLSPVMGIKLFYGMIQSRHVNISVAQQFVAHSRQIHWADERAKEIALALKALGDYGCTDRSVYEAMLSFLMTEKAKKQMAEHLESLITILAGLSYMQVFPASLYTMLFTGVQRLDINHPILSSEIFLDKLMSLDGTVAALSPYGGPRLDARIKKLALSKRRHKGRVMVYKDGTNTIYTQMLKTILNVVDSTPFIREKYIAQEENILEHFVSTDVVLTPKDQTMRRNVAIVVLAETKFLRLYKDRSDTSPRLQLMGWHRSRLLQLTKLGYVVVPVRFDEYARETDKSKLIIEKLQEAKIL